MPDDEENAMEKTESDTEENTEDNSSEESEDDDTKDHHIQMMTSDSKTNLTDAVTNNEVLHALEKFNSDPNITTVLYVTGYGLGEYQCKKYVRAKGENLRINGSGADYQGYSYNELSRLVRSKDTVVLFNNEKQMNDFIQGNEPSYEDYARYRENHDIIVYTNKNPEELNNLINKFYDELDESGLLNICDILPCTPKESRLRWGATKSQIVFKDGVIEQYRDNLLDFFDSHVKNFKHSIESDFSGIVND